VGTGATALSHPLTGAARQPDRRTDRIGPTLLDNTRGSPPHSFIPDLRRRWFAAVQAEKGSSTSAVLVQILRPGSQSNYAGFLTHLENMGRTMPHASSVQVLEELLLLAVRDCRSRSFFKGLLSTVRMLEKLEWIDPPIVVHSTHWEYQKSVPSTPLQDYLPPFAFTLMWPHATTPHLQIVFATALLSYIYLLRVGEAKALAPHHLSGPHFTHILTKSKSGTATHRLAPIALAWSHLLSDLLTAYPSDTPIFPTEDTLQTGLQTLLFGTIWATFSWHSLRRGGAAYIYQVGISWGAFLVWGRWEDDRTARRYATAGGTHPSFREDLRLPDPSSTTGISWAPVVLGLWPASLFADPTSARFRTQFPPTCLGSDGRFAQTPHRPAHHSGPDTLRPDRPPEHKAAHGSSGGGRGGEGTLSRVLGTEVAATGGGRVFTAGGRVHTNPDRTPSPTPRPIQTTTLSPHSTDSAISGRFPTPTNLLPDFERCAACNRGAHRAHTCNSNAAPHLAAARRRIVVGKKRGLPTPTRSPGTTKRPHKKRQPPANPKTSV
jgi:hypothetical protein